VGKIKNIEPKNRPNTAMKSPGEPTPFLFYIITPKMERQYMTVDSSIRQDKSGKRVFRLQTLAVFEIIMNASFYF
jgi:hypothetical protein